MPLAVTVNVTPAVYFTLMRHFIAYTALSVLLLNQYAYGVRVSHRPRRMT